MAATEDACIATFEMLIERLEKLEAAVERAAQRPMPDYALIARVHEDGVRSLLQYMLDPNDTNHPAPDWYYLDHLHRPRNLEDVSRHAIMTASGDERLDYIFFEALGRVLASGTSDVDCARRQLWCLYSHHTRPGEGYDNWKQITSALGRGYDSYRPAPKMSWTEWLKLFEEEDAARRAEFDGIWDEDD